MDVFALPALKSDAPYDLGRNTNALLEHYADTIKEKILVDGSAPPAFIVRSEKEACVLACGSMMKDDESKQRLSEVLRELIRKMEAVGFVFVCEAWLAKYDKVPDAYKDYDENRPSQRPDRIECLIVSAQYRGDKSGMRVLEMVRDRDGKLTHLVESDAYRGEEMSFQGRFAGLFDEEPENDRWRRIMDGI